MSRYLIMSGPTREYLDPVRFLTNASSGRMGSALAKAAADQGHSVTVITGPVQVEYPNAAEVIETVSTHDMLQAAARVFPQADCLIGAAAPCDYRPIQRADRKLAKSGKSLVLEFVETPDILSTLAGRRASQMIVGFALETHEHRTNALAKLRRKTCDLMVVNDASAIEAIESAIEVLDRHGHVILRVTGPKNQLAAELIALIEARRTVKR